MSSAAFDLFSFHSLIEPFHQHDRRASNYNDAFPRVIFLFWRRPLFSTATFPSGRTDIETVRMNKDPLLKPLVDDQDWHIWMDDRRSLLSYPVVSCISSPPLSHPSLLRSPFPLRLADGFDVPRFGNIGKRWQVCRTLFLPRRYPHQRNIPTSLE